MTTLWVVIVGKVGGHILDDGCLISYLVAVNEYQSETPKTDNFAVAVVVVVVALLVVVVVINECCSEAQRGCD